MLPTRSFADFGARKFVFIEGAVDPVHFAPRTSAVLRYRPDRKVIGSQAKLRSLPPLMEALRLLPDEISLSLFGPVPALAGRYQDMVDSGRVRFVGPLSEEDLPRFYHDCDCVVHSERFAGWANLAAEAMACGIPVICTRHGTLAFAEHGETALVIDEPTPEAIAAAVQRLFADDALAHRIASNGRQRITELSWSEYALRLMDACVDDNRSHHTFAPDLGLHGNWPLKDRLAGLESLMECCRGLSVLDFGSAEGVVALECLRSGASLVHGFELDRSRVDVSRELCEAYRTAVFRVANLSPWEAFEEANADLLLEAYDVVLYLGIHHHLPTAERRAVIDNALKKAQLLFAIRTPPATSAADDLDNVITSAGFEILNQNQPRLAAQGDVKIYARRQVPG